MLHKSPQQRKLRVLKNIARVGSLEFQQKARLQSTEQSYLLLDELIETTLSRVQLEIDNQVLGSKWSPAERDALQAFAELVAELSDKIEWQDDTLTLLKIVNEDAAMQRIRDSANECLRTLQISFSTEELLAD